MIRFYGEDMIDRTTNRFFYYCRPHDGKCEHEHMPLRDMAAAWDATKCIEYLHQEENTSTIRNSLIDATKATLDYYLNSFDTTRESNDLIMSQDFLLEPVNIGHSALLLLGLCNALECNIADDNRIDELKNAIDGLSRGILSMQLENGAFCTYYGDDNFQRGIAFFPGEAMLALVTGYKFNLLNTASKDAIMPAMMNAFHFYSSHYNEEDVDTNFNIWQSIAFSALYDCLENQHENQKEVARYVNTLCQDICQSRAWKYQLSRGQSFYANLETIEIACGLDALAEGIRVAKLEKNMELASQFEKNAAHAVQFLGWMQSRVPDSCVVGYGGMGYGGICVMEQRLDVTGHAISALLKLRKHLS